MAVFTLEDEQVVWTDKSSETNKSTSVKTGRANFQTNKSSNFVRLFVRLYRRTNADDLFVQTNKSTKNRPKFTLDEQRRTNIEFVGRWGVGTSKKAVNCGRFDHIFQHGGKETK